MKKILTFLLLLIYLGTTHSGLSAQEIIRQDSIFDKAIELDSVIVTGRMPEVHTIGAVTTIQVKSSVLSKMGNAVNMLSHTPGLHTGSESIEVNGMGVPIYVLDGRILADPKILMTLQANNIKKIEIDRMPSSQYSPDGQPVIKITTIKRANDYLFFNVANYLKQTCKFSEVPSFNLMGQLKKLSVNLGYMGGVEGNLNRETYFRRIYREEGIFTSSQQRRIPISTQAQRVSLSADYNISRKSKLGIYYFYQFTKETGKTTGMDLSNWLDHTNEKNIRRNSHDRSNLHSATVSYSYTGERNEFDITQDIAVNSGRSRQNTREQSPEYSSDIWNHDKSRYSIYSTTANYRFHLPWKINALAGVKYNYVDAKTTFTSDAPYLMDGDYYNSTDVTEHNPQVYISLVKSIKKFTIFPAIRYQYVCRHVNSLSGHDGIYETVKQHYSSYSPIITLRYRPTNDLTFSLNYRKTVIHPQFSQINAGLVYIDSLSYSKGNPHIQRETIDRISLSSSWKGLAFNLKYTYRHRPIINVEEQVTSTGNAVTSYSINLPRAKEFSMGLDYAKTFSKLSLYAEVEAVFPKGEYSFRGNVYQANRVAFNGQVNLNYAFNDNFYLYTDFTYQGRNEYLTSYQKAVNNWSLGATLSLIQNKLELNLAVNDILGKENYNNVSYYYGNIMHGTFGKNDMRGIELRVSYTLFNKDIEVKAKRQNEDIIQRIQ